VHEVHAACVHEVRGKPRDEEHLRRVAAELTERCAENLALPEERPEARPAELESAAGVFAASPGVNQRQLVGIDRLAFAWLAIEEPPQRAHSHAETTR